MGIDSRLSFFGVYDGHGGDKVALFAGENIHPIIAKQEAFKKGDLEQALKDGFLATDRAILNDPRYEEEVSGCTASVAIVSATKIFVGNAGDSRSVLGVKGRAKPLSFDHKPQNEGEKARITAAGGFVDFGRVNANLALSRAIGDFEFKKSAELAPEQQIVTAYPDVTVHDISDDDEFLVVACDGIWDCQSSQAVVEFVRRGIAAKQELSKRVANGDGPCAPPEYAEFRGPGVHHNFDDSDSGYDVDMDSKSKSFGGNQRGRIILLGDGTEVLTDSDDTEMFDRSEEDRDLASQVSKGQTNESTGDSEPKYQAALDEDSKKEEKTESKEK